MSAIYNKPLKDSEIPLLSVQAQSVKPKTYSSFSLSSRRANAIVCEKVEKKSIPPLDSFFLQQRKSAADRLSKSVSRVRGDLIKYSNIPSAKVDSFISQLQEPLSDQYCNHISDEYFTWVAQFNKKDVGVTSYYKYLSGHAQWDPVLVNSTNITCYLKA